MNVRLFHCAVACCLVACGAPARAEAPQAQPDAADAPPTALTIEGVADPAQLAAKPGGDRADRLARMVEQQAYADALHHVAAYALGQQFVAEFATGQDGEFRFVNLAYLPLSGTTPERREFVQLASGLTLGRFTFTGNALKRLRPRKGLADLPTVEAEAVAEITDPQQIARVTLGVLHWGAVRQCYRAAVLKQLRQQAGQRPVVAVFGRVYPVKVLEAGFKVVTDDQDDDDAPADDAGDPNAPPADQPRLPQALVYTIKMSVRVDIADVTFADQAPPDGSPGAAGDTEGGTPAQD